MEVKCLSDISIRNVDPVAISKIDEIWKKKGFRSREEYLRKYINNLAVLGEMKELDNRYQSMVNTFSEVIKNNTETLDRILVTLENLGATNSTNEKE